MAWNNKQASESELSESEQVEITMKEEKIIIILSCIVWDGGDLFKLMADS